jgi:hypothetical protein
MNKKLEQIESLTKMILAIEVLEYENKNLLSGDNKTRNEDKQMMLSEILKIINFINNEPVSDS